MVRAKETVTQYAAQAREELANLPDGPGRDALVTLVDYTATGTGPTRRGTCRGPLGVR